MDPVSFPGCMGMRLRCDKNVSFPGCTWNGEKLVVFVTENKELYDVTKGTLPLLQHLYNCPDSYLSVVGICQCTLLVGLPHSQPALSYRWQSRQRVVMQAGQVRMASDRGITMSGLDVWSFMVGVPSSSLMPLWVAVLSLFCCSNWCDTFTEGRRNTEFE